MLDKLDAEAGRIVRQWLAEIAEREEHATWQGIVQFTDRLARWLIRSEGMTAELDWDLDHTYSQVAARVTRIVMREFDAHAAKAQQRFAIVVVGHTDAEGADETNLALSQARADAVRAVIAPAPFANVTVTTTGVGSKEPAVSGQNEADNQRNRRVTLRVSRLSGGAG